MAKKSVSVIPARGDNEAERIPVAVYCRVSTKQERASDSLENQIQHYTEAIGKNPRYELMEIYYDFGISGFKNSRPGFQRMMKDAESHKFSLVITKAITRFARNTRTVLEATRRLKVLGIGVFFELQNINTLSQAGELLMTLLAAFGQAESEGARLHTLMSLKRRMEEGRPPRRLEKSMGYSKSPDGEFYPDAFAPLVLEIFEMAADGYTAAQITNYLNTAGIKNHNGCAFHRSSVTRLLRNPVYKGDFIFRKFFVNDDRKLVKNTGQRTKYYIEEDHIPIVTKELWDMAQATLDKATHRVAPTTAKPLPLDIVHYPYKNLLFCAECGHRLSRAVRAGRVLWECNGKVRFSSSFCSGVTVTDDEIRAWDVSIPIYIFPVKEKGKIMSHNFMTEEEWETTHSKKTHITSALDLTEENYPYKDQIYCKYCGSRLRRIVSNAGKSVWICNRLSREGHTGCKGIRIPDEKLRPLVGLSGPFYVGKEVVGGILTFGYSRLPDTQKPSYSAEIKTPESE